MTSISIEEERFLQRRRKQQSQKIIKKLSSSSLSSKSLSKSSSHERDNFFKIFRINSQHLSKTILDLEEKENSKNNDNNKEVSSSTTTLLTSKQRHELWITLSSQYTNLNKQILNYSTSHSNIGSGSSTTDIRILQDELDNILQHLIKIKETILFPKNKFTFRRYHEWKRLHQHHTNNGIDVLIEEKNELNNDEERLQQPILSSSTSSCSIIQEKHNENIKITKTSDDKEDVQCLIIKNNKNCTIELNESYQTIHILSCYKCTIKCSKPISSSIFIHECTNCNIFITSCKQLRIHDSIQTTFVILSITTGPIIENCNQLIFTNNNDDGDGDDDGKQIINNQEWKNIKDFSWLSVLKPSPNFTIKEKRRHVVKQQLSQNDNFIDSITNNDVCDDNNDDDITRNNRLAQNTSVIGNNDGDKSCHSNMKHDDEVKRNGKQEDNNDDSDDEL